MLFMVVLGYTKLFCRKVLKKFRDLLLGLVKIETYDSKLKPLSKLNLLVLKKENSMTNRIGAYMIASII